MNNNSLGQLFIGDSEGPALGDTIGLLLDCGPGTLTVYKNSERRGVMVEGLVGEPCWVATIQGKGCGVDIRTGLPPLGWRTDHTLGQVPDDRNSFVRSDDY